jgi:hypothetical protein
MDIHGTAQLAFIFGGFFRQNVTLEGLTALDGSARTYAKALFGAALRLHFWHGNICPSDSSDFNMIAGGNNSLRLDACSHLFCSGLFPLLLHDLSIQTSHANSNLRLFLFLWRQDHDHLTTFHLGKLLNLSIWLQVRP